MVFTGLSAINRNLETNWIRICNYLRTHGVRGFYLTGGEPSLHPDFLQIVHALQTFKDPIQKYGSESSLASENEFLEFTAPYSIMTNGNSPIFTKKFCEQLAQTGGRLSINFSDIQMVKPKSSKSVTGSLSRSQAYPLITLQNAIAVNVDFRINMTLHHQNEPTLVSQMKSLIHKDVHGFQILPLVLVGKATENKDLALSITQLKVRLKEIDDLSYRYHIFVKIGSLLPRCLIPPEEYPHLHLSYKCGCGKYFMCVDPSGLIRPCTLSNKIWGHLHIRSEFH